MEKRRKPPLTLEKGLVRWMIANIMHGKDGFTFSHNIRFCSPTDKTTIYPTLEEEHQRYREWYGQGNFRFEEAVTDKFGGRLPKAKYYRAVYVKSSHSLPL